MPNVASTQSPAAENTQWEEQLCESAREVFEMMIGLPLERSAALPPGDPGEFTAVIGLAGQISGVFAMRCHTQTATAIAAGMLGLDEEAARAQLWDALGEVCNMVIGSFKHKLGKAGDRSVISVPTVICGHDYRVRPLAHGLVAECAMQSASGVLHLRLDYKIA